MWFSRLLFKTKGTTLHENLQYHDKYTIYDLHYYKKWYIFTYKVRLSVRDFSLFLFTSQSLDIIVLVHIVNENKIHTKIKSFICLLVYIQPITTKKLGWILSDLLSAKKSTMLYKICLFHYTNKNTCKRMFLQKSLIEVNGNISGLILMSFWLEYISK